MPDDVRRTINTRYKMSERADIGEGDENPAENFFPDKNNHTPNTPVGRETHDHYGDEGAPAALNPLSALGSSTRDANHSSKDFVMVFPGVVGAPLSPTPRPLVHRCTSMRKSKNEEDEIMSVLKAQIIQDGLCCDKEHERREKDHRDRNIKRKEERESREAEAGRHENMMQMMIMIICKSSAKKILEHYIFSKNFS